MPLTPAPGLSARPTINADPGDLSSGGPDDRSPVGDLGGPPLTGLGAPSADRDHDAATARSPAELLAEIHALRGMVASLPLIEQAKGAVMLAHGLSADAAFDLLHARAERAGISVRDLADRLTAALTAQPPAAGGGGPMDRLLSDLADRPGPRKKGRPRRRQRRRRRRSTVHRVPTGWGTGPRSQMCPAGPRTSTGDASEPGPAGPAGVIW